MATVFAQTHPWEAENYFDLNGQYTWTFEKVDGDYADPLMTVAMVPITGECNQAGLEAIEEEAEHMFEACGADVDHSDHDHRRSLEEDEHFCVETDTGGTLPVGVNATDIHFDENSWVTVVHVNYVGCVGVFTAHFPSEFNAVFASADGSETLEFPEAAAEENKRWGEAILANVICTIPTLMALVFVGKVKTFVEAYLIYPLMFAFGVLISTSLFHIYPEGLHLLNFSSDFPDGHDAEVAVFWTSGIAVSLAFIGLLGARMYRIRVESTTQSKDVAEFEETETAEPVSMQKGKWNSTTFAILVGDAAHNFVDGVVIGTSFLTCSTSFAWTITFAILGHEAAHEVADILILLAQGFSTWEVALYNCISGLISILGTVLVFEADPSSNMQGLLLCFSAGTFLALAFVELMPEIEVLLRRGQQYGSVVPFIVGMFLMGILLLNHEHCEAEGGGHDHAH